MYLARILYPVESLGPGKRIGIWFCGCPHHCQECSNPELWDFDSKYSISLQNALNLIYSISDSNIVDGFTITGGEPFFQPEALCSLVDEIYSISDDILVYSGYTLNELREQQNSEADHILEKISVLIDGRYVHERNNGCSLRGSDNQQIHFLSDKHKDKYDLYMQQPNRIQNFTIGNSVISVGIHKADYANDFEQNVGNTELRKTK